MASKRKASCFLVDVAIANSCEHSGVNADSCPITTAARERSRTAIDVVKGLRPESDWPYDDEAIPYIHDSAEHDAEEEEGDE